MQEHGRALLLCMKTQAHHRLARAIAERPLNEHHCQMAVAYLYPPASATSGEGIIASTTHHPSQKTGDQFCTDVHRFQYSEQNGEKEENAISGKHHTSFRGLGGFFVYFFVLFLIKWCLSLQKILAIQGQRQRRRKLFQISR